MTQEKPVNYELRHPDPATEWKDAYYNLNRNDPYPTPTLLLNRLWIGGTPDDDILIHPGTFPRPWKPSVHKENFDSCVTLTPLAGPAGTGISELRVTFPDTDKTAPPPLEILQNTISWARQEHAQGKRILVRCHAGLNRSGLIAVPLMTWIDPTLSFSQALEKARNKRHHLVLCRDTFRDLAEQLANPNSQ